MESVLIIGTGRAAQQLGDALWRSGAELAGVAGRNPARTQELATRWTCLPYALGSSLPPAGMYLLAVSDDAIQSVAATLVTGSAPMVHLSGTRSLDLLLPHGHRGVLWPVQSLSTGAPMDLAEVPLVIDATDADTLRMLRRMAGRLSGTVVTLPFEQRRRLHLSAVLASNFPAFLLREAQRLLTAHGIDPQLVLPLWKATTKKAATKKAAKKTTKTSARPLRKAS